jgi:hypothetical protein
MTFTCKSNKPTSFDFCMLGLRFDKQEIQLSSMLIVQDRTAKFSKIRLYTMKESANMKQFFQMK